MFRECAEDRVRKKVVRGIAKMTVHDVIIARVL